MSEESNSKKYPDYSTEVDNMFQPRSQPKSHTLQDAGGAEEALKACQTEQQQEKFKTEAQVKRVAELTPSDVRWFYQIASSDDKKKWKPMKGRDSIIIDLIWRQKHNLEPCWDEGEVELEQDSFLGGLYRLVPDDIVLAPIYWEGDNLPLKRGTWFTEGGDPLDAELAEAIEQEHLRVFKGQSIPEKPIFGQDSNRPILTTLAFEKADVKVEWNSIVDVHMVSTTRTKRVARYLNIIRGRSRLFRGYYDLQQLRPKPGMLTEAEKPISHLVFVVHGIGHKHQVGRIVESTSNLRAIAESLLSAHFSDRATRPVFIPVQWRSSLTLDGDELESITIPHMRSVRESLNASGMDVMYYTSPKYFSEIKNGLSSVLNQLFRLFLSHNPGFLRTDGKVSVVAHSLGSVIAYDILTGWSPLQQYDDYVHQTIEKEMSRAQDPGRLDVLNQIHSQRQSLHDLEGGFLRTLLKGGMTLEFPVEHLFCLGSPLAVFLSLRGSRGPQLIPPPNNCRRIFNVFHPTDPVAYRVEPLVHKGYRQIAPLQIHQHAEAMSRVNYERMETRLETRAPSPDLPSLEPVAVSDSETPDPPNQEASSSSTEAKQKSRGWFSRLRSQKEPSQEAEAVLSHSSSQPDILRLRVLKNIEESGSKLDARLDYVLRQGVTEVNYWSVLTSHFCYWTHKDVIMFILTSLYPAEEEGK